METIIQIGISLGLGLLVGLQREWGPTHVAGIRTFALVTVFGTVCAQLSSAFGPLLLGAGLLSVAAMTIVSGLLKFKSGDITEPGMTTQAAVFLMFAVGAVVVVKTGVSIILGGIVAVLLHWKAPLHAFVHRIGEKDLQAVIRLTIIALIILPILPDKTYGPYGVLNPFHIWLMVALIVGISVAGYIFFKFLGPQKGALFGGIIGGIISSTATTVSYSRRSMNTPKLAFLAAVVIMIASSIVFFRVIAEILIVAPEILLDILPPLTAMILIMVLVSTLLYYRTRNNQDPTVLIEENPADLKAAVVFGALYAVVLFGIAWAKEDIGNKGLYFVAALSGLTDMDAITLSTSELIQAGRLSLDTGWRMIIVGALSNMVFKAGLVAVLGNRRLLKEISIAFSLCIGGGGMLLLFWPVVK